MSNQKEVCDANETAMKITKNDNTFQNFDSENVNSNQKFNIWKLEHYMLFGLKNYSIAFRGNSWLYSVSPNLFKKYRNNAIVSFIERKIHFLRRDFFTEIKVINWRTSRRQHVKLANVVNRTRDLFFRRIHGWLSLNLFSFIGRHPDFSPFSCFRRAC